MILSFSTQLNGKPTYFVERIHKGFRLMELIMKAGIDPTIHYPPDYNFVAKDKKHHKIHTIREDKKDRWKPGTKIDFFINCRQKNMFRFAPVLPVTSTQRIFMTYMPHVGNGFQVSIGGNEISKEEIIKLAINDGFENVEDFENYFISVMKEDEFSGKIIHWTDKRY
jgi:hypothetical protein